MVTILAFAVVRLKKVLDDLKDDIFEAVKWCEMHGGEPDFLDVLKVFLLESAFADDYESKIGNIEESKN